MQRYMCQDRLSSLFRTIYVKPSRLFCQKMLAIMKLYRLRAKTANFNVPYASLLSGKHSPRASENIPLLHIKLFYRHTILSFPVTII